MSWYFRYLELILGVAGLVCTAAVIWLFPHTVYNKWVIAGTIVLIIGMVHGLMYFLIQLRQNRLRRHAINEMADMVRDRINNPLTVVLNCAGSEESELVAQADRAMDEIRKVLSNLSEEALAEWRRRYFDIPVEPAPVSGGPDAGPDPSTASSSVPMTSSRP